MNTKIAIHGKFFGIKEKVRINFFFEKLIQFNFIPVLSQEFSSVCSKMKINNSQDYAIYTDDSNFKDIKFAFSLGGDGTLLELLSQIGDYEIPIVGISMGRLGFLATTSLADIDTALNSLVSREYEIDERVLLQMISSQKLFQNKNFALNDFTILKRDSSSMIKVKAFLNGLYLNTYWADGLIISTPTGSTSYSLSCGGPLILPQSRNFIITPVSPHNLNARPLVVSDHCEISFEIEARNNNVLISLDSRSVVASTDIIIKIKKYNKTGKLIKFKNYNQFDIMRNKLNWGVDYRN